MLIGFAQWQATSIILLSSHGYITPSLLAMQYGCISLVFNPFLTKHRSVGEIFNLAKQVCGKGVDEKVTMCCHCQKPMTSHLAFI